MAQQWWEKNWPKWAWSLRRSLALGSRWHSILLPAWLAHKSKSWRPGSTERPGLIWRVLMPSSCPGIRWKCWQPIRMKASCICDHSLLKGNISHANFCSCSLCIFPKASNVLKLNPAGLWIKYFLAIAYFLEKFLSQNKLYWPKFTLTHMNELREEAEWDQSYICGICMSHQIGIRRHHKTPGHDCRGYVEEHQEVCQRAVALQTPVV